MKNTKLVPELRFPEFTGEWKQETAGHYFSNRSEKGKDGLTVLSVVQSSPRIVKRDSLDREFDNAAKSSSNKQVYPGDLAYNTMRMWQGAVAIADIHGMLSAAYTVLQPKNDTNAEYFNYLFRTNPSLYKLWAYSYGLTSDRLRLYYKDFAMIPFRVPSPTEQQKIATFLTLVDRRLAAARRRVALLEEWKRGVMAKKFSFIDDSYPKGWTSISLARVAKNYGGLSGKTKEDFGEGMPYITYRQVFGTPFVQLSESEKVNIDPSENQNTVNKGDILFTTSSETPMEVAYAAGVREDFKQVYLNSFCFGLRFNDAFEVNTDYATYYFRSQHFRRVAYKLGQGSTRYNISKKAVMKHHFPYPSLEEQNRIAAALTTIDARLDAAHREVATWEQWKKGLLQKMLV